MPYSATSMFGDGGLWTYSLCSMPFWQHMWELGKGDPSDIDQETKAGTN